MPSLADYDYVDGGLDAPAWKFSYAWKMRRQPADTYWVLGIQAYCCKRASGTVKLTVYEVSANFRRFFAPLNPFFCLAHRQNVVKFTVCAVRVRVSDAMMFDLLAKCSLIYLFIFIDIQDGCSVF